MWTTERLGVTSESHLVVVVLVAHVFDDVVCSVHSRLDLCIQLVSHTSIFLWLRNYTKTHTEWVNRSVITSQF